ncbi:MAG TPA: CRISPR-associated RAMP protein Csx7, partial [Ktedonobacteraceae bacterium]
MATNGQINPAVVEHRYELRNRYIFRGKLVMQTALHIGGGKVTLSSSDSPVVLTPDQKPFIPGSSFKGALRSTVEKLAATLPGFSTCALIEYTREAWTTEQNNGRKIEDICPTVRQWHIAELRRNSQTPKQTEEINRQVLEKLCDTCRLFGSPYTAARLNVSDLYIPEEVWSGVIQTRDGVAIDRDSEKARDRLKYDFEVVPASATFTMEIVLENAEPADLQLVCVGLSEYMQGFGVIGGKRSRGLGVAKLEEDEFTVDALELVGKGIEDTDRRQRLQDYLVSREFTPGRFSGSDF